MSLFFAVSSTTTSRRVPMESLSLVDDVNLKIAPSTITNAGNGLFALRDFARGEPITAYCGEMITYDTACQRRQAGRDTHIRMHIALRWCIDGARTEDGKSAIADPARQLFGRGGGAFANHKPKKDANARFDASDSAVNEARADAWLRGDSGDASLLPAERVTLLRATKPICAGEEIFADYGRTAAALTCTSCGGDKRD